MFLDNYCCISNEKVTFTRAQASTFAKQIADDFNPLHDIDAKRFCVPGDLLFAMILNKAGLHQDMTFTFSGMVTEDSVLNFPSTIDGKANVSDDNGKEYMSVEAEGEKTNSSSVIESLIRSYVEFSGHTFPDMLIKLMEEKGVMINPARPMIMYESMSIHLDSVELDEVSLELSQTTLEVDGKRGKASLMFNLVANGKKVGYGKKFMLLSGLRAYCQESIEGIVSHYHEKKASYVPQKIAS